jgi:hypothetical protein
MPTCSAGRDFIPHPRQYRSYGQPLFICPSAGCERRCAHLYAMAGELTCRHCLKPRGVDYRSRHVRSPDLLRVARLRRRIGADVHPFGSVPPRPRGRGRAAYNKIIAELAACEARVLGVLSNINEAIARRAPELARLALVISSDRSEVWRRNAAPGGGLVG